MRWRTPKAIAPGQAAAEFERIAADPKEDRKVQREALLQSADLYTKANNMPKAVAMLEKFVATNPTPVADAMEARQRLADYRRQEWRRREARPLVSRDREGRCARRAAARTDRTKYLAAKAQLSLAQPVRDAFRGVRLTAPLKKSLVGKRRRSTRRWARTSRLRNTTLRK